MMPIGIVRMAACSPLGASLAETVEALRSGAVGIRRPDALEQVPAITAGAGEVPLPDSDAGIDRAEALVRRAIDALLTDDDRASIREAPARWGIVLGTTLAGMRHCGHGMRTELAGRSADADRSFARTAAASVLGHATRGLGINGPTMSISRACASALTAVAEAQSLLASGAVDSVIAGGYDPIAEFAYGGFAALQLVAVGPLSPFAHEREGMKLGEGVALLLLRRMSDVPLSERAALHGIITGAAQSSDAHHLTRPHPRGAGAARVLREVIGEGADPELIVAHATGTQSNDDAEYAAYRAVFGTRLSSVPVVALKSRFGHPLGAAGALELVSVMGCAARGFVPTTAGRPVDREAFADLRLLAGAVPPDDPASAPRDIVALSAGFGGANAALRVRRPGDDPSDGHTNAPPAARLSALNVRGVGAVSPAGRGIEALAARVEANEAWPEFSEETLAPLLDRAKTRRLALLPRLMMAAVRDLLDRTPLTSDELRDTPLVAASWCGAADFTERYYRDLVTAGIDLANPMLFAESVPNIGSAHCSAAFGIEAPTSSVVGSRTSALEALLLVMSRISIGAWSRAIVVAAEESHTVVERVLSRCAGGPVALRSCGIAILVERADRRSGSDVGGVGRIEEVVGRSLPLDPGGAARLVWEAIKGDAAAAPLRTSASPFDCAFDGAFPGVTRVPLAEFGAASPFATLFGRSRTVGASSSWVGCSDPHGSCWAVRGD